MIFVDSDVFLIDLRYRRDEKFDQNRAFLDTLESSGVGATTLPNLLELCGILSFNLNRQQLWEFFHYFPDRFGVHIVPESTLDRRLPPFAVRTLLNIIARQSAFGDALILAVLEQHQRDVDLIVSWNARHFEGRIDVEALPPSDAIHRL